MFNIIEDLPITKFIVVGSFPLMIRYSKDIDVICYSKDIMIETKGDEWSKTFEFRGKKIECLLADKAKSLQQILDNHKVNENAHIWELYALKCGHIIFPHKQWDKHINDIHLMKNIVYAGPLENIAKAYELSKLHKKATEDRYKLKTPKLIGVSKNEFFDDFVTKYYVHDNIHKCMAHKEKPMYEYMQKNPDSVECSKELWDRFPLQDKIQCVLEEAYVIALERHIIPAMKKSKVAMVEFLAFKWALMRICTTLCSGWFRQFAIDNYFLILNSYNKDFVEKFKQNIDKYEPVRL